MNNRILNIFQTFNILYKKKNTELKYTTNFEFLIALILSPQSTDLQVNKVTNKLFYIANTPKKLFLLGEKKIKKIISSIGLHNRKAHFIYLTSLKIYKEFNSIIPHNRKDILSLPGVGIKIANIISNDIIKNNKSYIAVDRHVARVSNRLNLTNKINPLLIEKDLLKIIPKIFHKHAHNYLVIHGKYICKKRNPICNICKISYYCLSKRKYEKNYN